MSGTPDQPEDLDDEAPDVHDDFIADEAIVYDSRTARLRTYASLLRATIPRIGTATQLDGGGEAEIDADVVTARNLAIEAIFADIRRIAGDGIRTHGEDSR